MRLLQVALLDALGENLKQPHENVQRAAASALRQLLHFYFAAPIGSPAFQKLQKMTVLKFVAGLQDAENVAWTRGYSLALGVLPFHVVANPAEVLDNVLATLSRTVSTDYLVAGEPDADTRRNAVYAVSEVGERFALHVFKQGGVFSGAEDNCWMRRSGQCMGILLSACDDYTVDKRGDTGSWSRIAAMLGLERLVYAFSRASVTFPVNKMSAPFTFRQVVDEDASSYNSLAIGSHVWTSYGHGIIVELNDFIGVVKVKFPLQSLGYVEFLSTDGVCTMRTRKLIVIGNADVANDPAEDEKLSVLPVVEKRTVTVKTPFVSKTTVDMIDATAVESFVCVILKQLGEKLDVVRGVAGAILARILDSMDPQLYSIKDRKLLSAAISSRVGLISTSALNWKMSSFSFPFLGEILDSEAYFHWIISGCVISVGGLTEAIVKDSSKTLLKWCREKKKRGDVRSISRLSQSILKLFRDNERNDRVIVPLLKTLQLLFQNAIFDDLSGDAPFFEKLYLCLKTESSRCSDTRKLRGCVDVYMFLINSAEPLRRNSLRALIMMLGHQYPQVRKYVAEQLYLLFIGDPFVVGPRLLDDVSQNETSTRGIKSGLVLSQELAEKVIALLTETVWDRQLVSAREVRGQIADAMDIALNIKARAADTSISGPKIMSDELDSYEALVRDAGY